MTNLEKIKEMTIEEMTVEEMVEFLLRVNRCSYCSGNCSDGCRNSIEKWLESEVENND